MKNVRMARQTPHDKAEPVSLLHDEECAKIFLLVDTKNDEAVDEIPQSQSQSSQFLPVPWPAPSLSVWQTPAAVCQARVTML